MLGWWKGHWIQAGGRCQGDSLGKWHILVGTAPGGTNGKEFTCQCRRHKGCGFDPGTGRSPGEENGKPLQYPCLKNSMDRGAWWATVHGIAKSQTQLSNSHTQTHILTGSFSPNDLNYCSDLMDVSLFKVSGCLCNSAWWNDAKGANAETGWTIFSAV